ncbi:hypothetical protein IQ283_08385 (plasmid) [Alkalihalobacillus hwajinpoensis]|uniref:hypothetical protein n=1 Tax=Guptibacillus hwajinpoensis TaxID=208199 RepID=UPI001883C802|nr:hypothetical protein [Pseudalkalibacillus hwajinpoensis]MBF0706626.1 hypothetical protein [Pseudalkalibacillus hwajinpoensis]
MKNMSLMALVFVLLLVLGACSNDSNTSVLSKETNSNSNSQESVFSSDDMNAVRHLIEEVLNVYEEEQQNFTSSEDDEVNEKVENMITERIGESIPGRDISVSIAADHDNTSGKDDFVEDPNDCREETDGMISEVYERGCKLNLVFDKSKVLLAEWKEVNYPIINVTALIIPFKYEGKDTIDTEFVFAKTIDGEVQLLSGLGLRVLNLENEEEDAVEEKQNGETRTIDRISKYKFR